MYLHCYDGDVGNNFRHRGSGVSHPASFRDADHRASHDCHAFILSLHLYEAGVGSRLSVIHAETGMGAVVIILVCNGEDMICLGGNSSQDKQFSEWVL